MTDTTPAVRIGPTDAMILAGAKAAQSAEAHHVSWKDAALSVWSAMEAAAPVAPAGEVTFLLERLADFEREVEAESGDAAVRHWHGHVVPAIARLKSALRARSEPEAVAVAWIGNADYEPTEAMIEAGIETNHRSNSEANMIASFKAMMQQAEIDGLISYTHPAPSDPSATERMRAALVEYDARTAECRIDGKRPQRDTTKACDLCGSDMGGGCGAKNGAAHTLIKALRAALGEA